MSNRLSVRYEVTQYRGAGHEPDVQTMNPEELAEIDLQSFDHVFWPSRNLMAFRTADGRWVERSLEGSGLGDVSLKILDALQTNPGMFVRCREIAELTSNENLCDTNALAARLKVMRKTFGESPRSPRFLVSRRRDYALMWPIERSFVRIEVIPAGSASDAA